MFTPRRAVAAAQPPRLVLSRNKISRIRFYAAERWPSSRFMERTSFLSGTWEPTEHIESAGLPSAFPIPLVRDAPSWSCERSRRGRKGNRLPRAANNRLPLPGRSFLYVRRKRQTSALLILFPLLLIERKIQREREKKESGGETRSDLRSLQRAVTFIIPRSHWTHGPTAYPSRIPAPILFLRWWNRELARWIYDTIKAFDGRSHISPEDVKRIAIRVWHGFIVMCGMFENH